MIAEELGEPYGEKIVVLSGPSHAEEVALKQPTTVTVSSLQLSESEKAQDLFMNNVFRVIQMKILSVSRLAEHSKI